MSTKSGRSARPVQGMLNRGTASTGTQGLVVSSISYNQFIF